MYSCLTRREQGSTETYLKTLKLREVLPGLIVHSSRNSSTFARDASIPEGYGYKMADVQ